MEISFSALSTTMERTLSVIMSLVKRQNVQSCTNKTKFISSVLSKIYVATINNKNHPEEIFWSLPISLTREKPHLTTKPLTYGKVPNTSRTSIMRQMMQSRFPEDSHSDNWLGTTTSAATVTPRLIPKYLQFLTTVKSNATVQSLKYIQNICSMKLRMNDY